MSWSLWVLVLLVGLGGGTVIGYVFRKVWAVREAQSAEARVKTVIENAHAKEREILIQAKEQSIKLIDDAKKDEARRRTDLTHLQERLEKRESVFDQKLQEVEQKQNAQRSICVVEDRS